MAARGGLPSSACCSSRRLEAGRAFHPNLTFVQDHLTFQPDAANPRQLGVLQGRLGDLEAGEVVLGYVILPAELRSRRAELDIYWDDRRSRSSSRRTRTPLSTAQRGKLR